MIYSVLPDYTYKTDIYNTIKIFEAKKEIIFSDNYPYAKKYEGFFLDIITKESNKGFSVDVILYKNNTKISSYTINSQSLEFFIESEQSKKRITIRHGIYKALSKYYGFESDYGILTGTRPVKFVRLLSEKGISNTNIKKILGHTFLLKEKTIDNLIKVYETEKRVLIKNNQNISIYIGIPFCPSICKYCSFGSYLLKNKEQLDDYLNILIEEIKIKSDILKLFSLNIKSIYIGGGTPSILNPLQLQYLMENLYKHINIPSDLEFSFEAGRPDTITEEKLKIIKKYGVNRISINPQSMNENTLKAVGRYHTISDIFTSFEAARKIGFNTINMDFINGLYGETIKEANENLKYIEKLKPENVTIHNLSIKKGSYYHKNNYVNQKSSDSIYSINNLYKTKLRSLEMEMYYLYRQKNINSNADNYGFATKNHESIYNINIIEEIQTILAFGASSSSKLVDVRNNSIQRIANNKDLKAYASKLHKNYEQTKKIISHILT
jgi:oxygen-independent coproporphyrinogen-3 oxidase